MSKEQKIIELVDHLKTCLEDINQQLTVLYDNGVDIVFNIKHPYDTKSGNKIELSKVTKLVDYLTNE
jgi:hypothetical protein